MSKRKTKCIVCKDINPLGIFHLCCGESICYTCMHETIGKPCPTCGVINEEHHSEKYILRCHTRLAAQGHQGAIDHLPVLLNILATMTKNPKVRKEAIHYIKRSTNEYGSIHSDLGMNLNESVVMKREAIEMALAGKSKREITEYLNKETDVRPKNGMTLEQMKADTSGLFLAEMCSHCGISNPEYKCGRCKSAMFCNRGCQKAGWKMHKKQCNKKPKA